MKVGIIGLGLIGGSLAIAIKKRLGAHITGYNRTIDTLMAAKKSGVIDDYTTEINEAFKQCEIIFICVPVLNIPGIVEKLSTCIDKNTIVTDVGSTKKIIASHMEKFRDFFVFIGGHPMAGSEQSGFLAAREFLFENAYYLLTPYSHTPIASLNKLSDTVKAIGAIPLIMSANKHDETVGAISHVPHIIAMTLVNTVKEACRDNDNAKALASGGFKDITRIASSSPEMWHDISIDNKDNILSILSTFKAALNCFEKSLINMEDSDIYKHFEKAKQYRDEFSSIKRPSSMHVIKADVEDKPGVISLVSTAFSFNNINIKNIGIANNREYENGILEIIVEDEEDKNKGKAILQANGFVVY